MFDFLEDLEFDTNALAVTLFVAVLFGAFFFLDPMSVGMEQLKLSHRILGWVAGCVVGYFVALRMLDG